jgi:hypothetical protein
MASRGEAARAVDLLLRAFDESMRYYDWNNDFMHVRPEFEPIREDPAFVALMRSKG